MRGSAIDLVVPGTDNMSDGTLDVPNQGTFKEDFMLSEV